MCWRNILLCLSEVSAMLPLKIKGSGSYFWMAGVQIEGLKYLVVRRLCSPPDSLYILYVWTKFSPLHRVSLQRQRDIQKTEKATPLKKQTKKTLHQHEDMSQIKPAAPALQHFTFPSFLCDESIKQLEWGRETKFILSVFWSEPVLFGLQSSNRLKLWDKNTLSWLPSFIPRQLKRGCSESNQSWSQNSTHIRASVSTMNCIFHYNPNRGSQALVQDDVQGLTFKGPILSTASNLYFSVSFTKTL